MNVVIEMRSKLRFRHRAFFVCFLVGKPTSTPRPKEQSNTQTMVRNETTYEPDSQEAMNRHKTTSTRLREARQQTTHNKTKQIRKQKNTNHDKTKPRQQNN